MSHRWQHAAAMGWHLLVAACVFWKVALTQQVLYWGDLLLYFLPMTAFAQRWLTQGILPLWNPHMLFGQPFVGNPQEWLFYPSTLLLPLGHPARYLSWNTLLHLWLGGVGMWLFLRARGVEFRPALLGSTAWSLCGAFVPRAQFPGMFQSIALVGWLLWAVERVLQERTAGRVAALAVAVALVLLAGHAQVAYLALLLSLAWAAWRQVGLHGRAWVSLLVGMAGGILLSAAHWLPLLQLLHETGRVQLSIQSVNRFPLRPEQLPLLLVPDLYGTPWQGNWVGRGNYWEVAFTIGLLPLMAAWASYRSRSEARFWLAAAGISLWLALGTAGGLYRAAYYLLPGFRAFHDPARWLILTDFCLCVAAALGWERLRPSRRWWILPLVLALFALWWSWGGDSVTAWVARGDLVRASRPETISAEIVASAHATAVAGCVRGVSIACLAVLILRLSPAWRWRAGMALTVLELLPFAIAANPTTSLASFSRPPATVHVVQGTGGRLFVPDQAPMWRQYVSYLRYGPSSPEYLRRWQEMLGSNIGMLWGVREASGYEPVAVRRAVRHYHRLAQRWKEGSNRDDVLRELQHAGVGAVATGRDVGSWQVTALPHRPVRARMLPAGEPLRVRDLSPQWVEIRNVPAGELVLADTAYPGWRVWVDDVSRPWRVAGGVFRAVTVPAPAARAVWRYEPDTFRIGLYLSLLGWGVVAGAVVAGLCAGKRLSPARGR